jgi:hypothetical protein
LTEAGNWYSTITIDGTDFSIYEPTPFSTKWFSHKLKGLGVRYELAISIGGGAFFISTVHSLLNVPTLRFFVIV